MFASVGDVSSRNIIQSGLKPRIVVVDNKVMRKCIAPQKFEGRAEIIVENPSGKIKSEVWRALKEAVTLKRDVAVIVEGEEDLLVLPLIILMPHGSAIVYGQPHAGIVLIKVTEERKRWAEEFIERMEEK